MRFDRNQGPPPFLNRQHQNKMLMLLGSLVMVLVLIKVVAQPTSWNWFFAISGTPIPSEHADSKGTYGPLQPLNPVELIHERNERLPVDVVYASVEVPARQPAATDPVSPESGASGETPAGDTTAPDGEGTPPSPTNAVPARTEPAVPAAVAVEGQQPGTKRLPAELMEGVVDDRFRFTRNGKEAIDRIMAAVGTPAEAQWPGKVNELATFDVVFNDPQRYRGELIRVEGRCKRMIPFDNQTFGSLHDPLKAFEFWVITPESRSIPWMILANAPPAGMPQGGSIDEKVSIDCYVVQRIGYPAKRGEGTTMLCVASDVRWIPLDKSAADAAVGAIEPVALIAGGVVVVLILGVVGWYIWSGRGFRGSHLESIASSRFEAHSEDLASLGNLDGGDPHRIQIPEESSPDRPT